MRLPSFWRNRQTAKFLFLPLLFAGLFGSRVSAEISGVWANDGGDKVTRDELRVGNPNGRKVINHCWDGHAILVTGAKNEVVSFNLVIEAVRQAADDVSVTFDSLEGPGGTTIHSTAATGNGVFSWVNRPIELFYVRYLQIKGLSLGNAYGDYDQRHVPERLRRPWSGQGVANAGTTWKDRPDHDKFYPDIAVPLELVPAFHITTGGNQSIWADIYIPKDATPGVYTGQVTISEKHGPRIHVPVRLKVHCFALPDVPSARTMIAFSADNINERYIGKRWISDPADEARAKLIQDRHFLLAHRHRMSLIGDDSYLDSENLVAEHPNAHFASRLKGDFFTSANGYDGPGVNVGNNVYSVCTYGIPATWRTEEAMRRHSDAWVKWFEANSPETEYFLYLIDESRKFDQTETWAKWLANNPGPGKRLKSMATVQLPDAAAKVPTLQVVASALDIGITKEWKKNLTRYTRDPVRRLFLYNGARPAGGTFSTEDDGVALWVNAWIQYKMHIHRWFFWEATFYTNREDGGKKVNLFESAHTFGPIGRLDPLVGETGYNYANGDGVLVYPGTDTIFPSASYGVDGPFASLRMKQWRRGLQDHDYLTLAANVNPAAVKKLVDQMVPKVAWELGVSDPTDPTWVRADISWSTDPDVWAAARAQLAEMIGKTER